MEKKMFCLLRMLFILSILSSPVLPQIYESTYKNNQNLLLLNSDYDSAKVFIQDSLVGYTPLELFNFPTGKYNLRFTKDSLIVNLYNVEYTRGTYLEVTGIFKPGNALLTIYTNPNDAQVFLNDSLIGYTPINKKYIKSDVYNLNIKKNGYAELKQRLNLHSRWYHYDFQLESTTGEITLIRSDNEHFSIDNSSDIPEYNSPFMIGVGEHKISVSSKDYHKVFNETITVNPNESFIIKFKYNEKTLLPLFTSIIVPGLGQCVDNDLFKGGLIMAGNFIFGGLTVLSFNNYKNDLNSYNEKIAIYRNEANEFLIEKAKSEMNAAYDKANTSLKIRNLALGVFVIAYLYNLIDAYFNHSITGNFIISVDSKSGYSSSSILFKVPL